MLLSTQQKTTALKVWLVIFAIWPLVHHWMVTRYEMSPWKFFGWSMYCKPNSPVVVSLHSVQADGSTRMIQVRDWPEELTSKIDDWLNRRRVWGTFTSPRELADVVLNRWSAMKGVEVRLHRWELNPSNGWYEVQKKTYAYRR